MKKLFVVTVLIYAVFIASIPQAAAQQICACYDKNSGDLRNPFYHDASKPKSVSIQHACHATTEASICWNVTGPQGPSGPQGPPGIANTIQKVYTVGTIPAHLCPIVKVNCDPGQKVLGGGYNTPDGVIVVKSFPIKEGWEIAVCNFSDVDFTNLFSVYAICADMSQ